MRKKILTLYIVAVIGLLFILGVSVFVEGEANSNESKAKKPQILNGTHFNTEFLNDSEAYISQNYVSRNKLLDIYTTILKKGFHTSSVENVIVGTNGYLYFKDTLPDYTGTRQLNQRETFQIVRTLELMNEYVVNNGSKFLFVVAPNKNSLYDFMPYYYKPNQQKITYDIYDNFSHVKYVDLFKMFKEKNDILYYKMDSHWNNKGAYYAFQEIMSNIGKKTKAYSDYGQTNIKIKGDLYNMLYPDKDANENDRLLNIEKNYKYLTKTRNTEQNYIETFNKKAENSLLMFRDSFANNLVDYFSNDYRYAIYDKTIPYNLMNMKKYNSDTVILEIAERNIKNIQECKPQFLAPIRKLPNIEIEEKEFVKNSSIKKEKYIAISGTIKKDMLQKDSLVYLQCGEKIYELSPQMINGEHGFYGLVNVEKAEYSIYLVNKKIAYKQKIS